MGERKSTQQAREEIRMRRLYISSELTPLKNMLDESLKRNRSYDEEHGRKSDILTIELAEGEVSSISAAIEYQIHKMEEENEQMEQTLDSGDEYGNLTEEIDENQLKAEALKLEKDFIKIILDLGEAIANMADYYRNQDSLSNIAFGEACGMVVGMALNAYSYHDNSDDILQAAVILKAYAKTTKKSQAGKIMIQ